MKRIILALCLALASISSYAQSVEPTKICCFKCCNNHPPQVKQPKKEKQQL